MGFLIPVFAGVVLLLGSGLLVSTVGRRRRTPARPLQPAQVQAIEDVLGAGLADLVAHAVQLRQRIEDIAERERELLAIERELGGAPRRPLWRQIEAANFDQELVRLQRETLAWLTRFVALEARDRQILDRLAINIEPVRELVGDTSSHWGDPSSVPETPDLPANGHTYSGASFQELHQLQARLESAATCLRQLELEISGYRGDVYR